MDLLIEKLDGSRYYLSQYKVLITDFEESAPSVTRNSKQLDQHNGNIDFGGWHTDKTINITGYYRADDIDEEEMLREKLYALLSDPDGYYITQLKTTPNTTMERPGETSGGYYDKLSNYPSHKRFLVYTEAPEMELVGNVNGTLLYKLSVEFKTMKLPYGESVPRNFDVKPNVPYYGRNLIHDTSFKQGLWKSAFGNPSFEITSEGNLKFSTANTSQNGVGAPLEQVEMLKAYTLTAKVRGHGPYQPYIMYADNTNLSLYTGLGATYPMIDSTTEFVEIKYTFTPRNRDVTKQGVFAILTAGAVGNWLEIKKDSLKLESGNKATDWCPNPSDLEYGTWYTKTYYNADNLFIPYAGTVPCNQLEQGFTIELTAKDASSSLSFKIDDTELTYSGAVADGDVFMFTGFSYTQNGLSIVSKTNKAYFILQPDNPNQITCNVPGTVRILGFQNMYA